MSLRCNKMQLRDCVGTEKKTETIKMKLRIGRNLIEPVDELEIEENERFR